MNLSASRAALAAWMKQPTTVTGIAGFMATLAYAAAHLVSHDMPVATVLAGVAASLTAMILPDNSAAKTSIEQLVQDSVTAAANQHLAAALPALVQDAVAVVRSVSAVPATSPAVAPGAAAAPTSPAVIAAA